MTFDRYQAAVKFLESLINLPIKDYLLKQTSRSFYIDRLRWFLKLLDNPQNGFKYIHVAGTAGKGSVVKALHEILTVAGKKTGSYYSPHPTTAIERIEVGQKYISPSDFIRLINKLKSPLAEAALKSPFGQPSYFETFLALAFLYFNEKKCEYVILEAGLGGRHDATNVIPAARVNVITNINFDHTEILGKTLKAIATDKLGIVKKGSTLFTAENRPALLKIFTQRCQKLKVPFMTVSNQTGTNNQLIVTIAKHLKIKEKFIQQGLKRAQLPCRFEIMQQRPLVILDGSHNPSKLKFLTTKLKDVKFKKLKIILAMAADKDLNGSLKQILPVADELVLTRFLLAGRKSADLGKMYQSAKKIKPKLPIKIMMDPWQALNDGLKTSAENDCLLICGSFFLAGELRKKWFSEKIILKNRSNLKI